METENKSLCTELGETTEAIPPNDGNNDLLDDATSDGTMLPKSDADISWEHRLGTLKQSIERLQEDYEQSYLEIGRLLIQAKDTYKGHGSWIKWLTENAPFSVRHAQRLIRVAEMFDGDDATLVSRLGLTSSKAYILTRIGKNDVSHFLNSIFLVEGKGKLVKDMSRRELELEVTAFLRDKMASTNQEVAAPNQGRKTAKGSVEENLENLKKALSNTIASIMSSDSGSRDSWTSVLEELCRTGLDELTQASK